MISSIHGLLISANPSFAIIEAYGVGYKIFISALTFSKLPALSNSCKLFTVQVIREQSNALYGFLNSHSCDIFEMLIGITGIGPKLALCILGHMTEAELFNAIAKEDINSLSKIPGIGKKTASRLLVELRDKKPTDEVSHALLNPIGSISNPEGVPWKLAINALVSLGYTSIVAQKAVQKALVGKEEATMPDLPALIAESLKNI